MRTVKHSVVFFLLASMMFSFNSHDFHSSTTKIVLNSQSNLLSIASKYFTEDLEKAVGVSASSSNFKEEVKSYVAGNFFLKINGKNVKIEMLGVENTHKATRVYLEVKGVSSVDNIEITNKMLIATFSDQQNIVDFDINGKRESTICSKSNIKTTLSFN